MQTTGQRILILLCFAIFCIFLFNLSQSDSISWNITPKTIEDNRINVSESTPIKKKTIRPLSDPLKRRLYPKRQDMGACPPLFGKVAVFVAFAESSYKTHYHVAQETLKCYLKNANYSIHFIDLFNDDRVNKSCNHTQLFFRKHCAAASYLNESDWMLVLDADTGIVNPNHCIEEWIDDRVDLIFYERYFNWEIAAGNYLVKNTQFARDFLLKWADWQYKQPRNWNGADNGVLQIHILQSVMPGAKAEIKACDKIWHKGNGIYRRAHGWVRDAYLTTDAWSEADFMLHGWKLQNLNLEGWESPFERLPNITECGNGVDGWYWRAKKRISTEAVRQMLFDFENSAGKSFPKEARIHPYLSEPDIGDCYPNCDSYT